MTAPAFIVLDSVDSTNNYAMARIRDGVAKHGTAWFSYEQTEGKGRRGKVWRASPGDNIILSTAVSTGFLPLYRQFGLSAAVALACREVFASYAGDECRIKWPNDLMWNDRKAGGILIENLVQGSDWQWSVIGTGININQEKFDIHSVLPPVSLKQITGKSFPVVDLAKQVQSAILRRYDKLKEGAFKKMLEEYNSHLYGIHRQARLKKDSVVFETLIRGVSEEGKLITERGAFEFDEVAWLGWA